jgi:hypothetical protein
MRTADHITEQLPRITTELRVLAAAGHNTFQPPLHLDREALAKLSAGPALAAVAATPFAVTPVTATDRAELISQMTVLAAAASADDRHIVWSAPDDALNDPDTTALHPATVDAATLRFDPATTTPGTVAVVDHAQWLTPNEIADLAESAISADVRLVLIDTEARQWSTAPSAPLLRLLNKDLPWSRTFSADHTIRNHPNPSQSPDLQAAVTQASDLDPHQRTPEITAALAEYERLIQHQRSAHGVHDRLQSIRGNADNRSLDRTRAD